MSTQVVRISSDVVIPHLTYSGQPVLTFALIDKVHNRVEGTASRNFRANRQRFIDGEDYFYVTDSTSLDEFRRSHPDVLKDAAREATFITESGYLMLVKSFTDDLSWQIQRQLVKCYFRFKEQTAPADPALEATVLKTAAVMRDIAKSLYASGLRGDALLRAVDASAKAVTGLSLLELGGVKLPPVAVADVTNVAPPPPQDPQHMTQHDWRAIKSAVQAFVWSRTAFQIGDALAALAVPDTGHNRRSLGRYLGTLGLRNTHERRGKSVLRVYRPALVAMH